MHLVSVARLQKYEKRSPLAWFPHDLFPNTSIIGPLLSSSGFCSVSYNPQKNFYPNRYTHLLTESQVYTHTEKILKGGVVGS